MNKFFWPETGKPSSTEAGDADDGLLHEQVMEAMLADIARDMGERGPALSALIDKPGDPAPALVEVLRKTVDARTYWLTEDFSVGGKSVERLTAAGPAYDQTLKALADYVDAHRA